MKDARLYGKFTLNFCDHPKIMILSDSAFRCLVSATLWSREQQTDGFLARRLATAKWSLADLQELSTNDDDKPSLFEREEGWYIHDYAEHQDTKADIEARRERNKLNGQMGGLAKAKRVGKRPPSKSPTKPLSEVLSENVAEKEKGGVGEILEPEVTTDGGAEPPLRCNTHKNLTDVPPCGACGRAREAHKAWQDNAFERKLQAKTVAAALRDSCSVCSGTNWVPNTEPAVKCNHQAVS